MRTLPGLDPEAAEDALVRLAAHVPPAVEIGRPFVARREEDGSVMIGSTVAWWWAYGDRAERLLGRDGRAEKTTYRDGHEIERVVDQPEGSGLD